MPEHLIIRKNNKMKRLILPSIILFVIFFMSCYYDSQEALYPSYSSSCDTANVTYSGIVVPILRNNCYSCHSNANAASFGANIKLENYNDLTSQMSTVVTAIKHNGSISPMPKNGGKLSICLLTQIDIWVRKGMLNN